LRKIFAAPQPARHGWTHKRLVRQIPKGNPHIAPVGVPRLLLSGEQRQRKHSQT
jgi:hypothetical protein